MSVKAAASSIPKAVKAGLVLSRVPIVTPELNALENKYYQYQAELERRLMWTFPSYFYFKKGTLAERRFQSVQKGVISKQPGVWSVSYTHLGRPIFICFQMLYGLF